MHENRKSEDETPGDELSLPPLPARIGRTSGAHPQEGARARVHTLPSMRPALAEELSEVSTAHAEAPTSPAAEIDPGASVPAQLRVLESAPVPTVFQLARASGRMARINVADGRICPVVLCCDGELYWERGADQSEREAAIAGITTMLVDAAQRGATLKLSEADAQTCDADWLTPAEIVFEMARRSLPELDAAIGALAPLIDEHIGAFWLIQRNRRLPALRRIRGLNAQANVPLHVLEALVVAADDVERSLAALRATVVRRPEIATGVIGTTGWCAVTAGDRTLMGRFPLRHLGRVVRIGGRLRDAIAQ